MNSWLKAGYAVVRTDYEGLGVPNVTHPYLIGVSEGRSVLDMVRAARKLDTTIGKNVVLAGHSQGGHAVLWANSHRPRSTRRTSSSAGRSRSRRPATSASRRRCWPR